MDHTCEKCGKTFSQKSKYTAHNKRKTPCNKFNTNTTTNTNTNIDIVTPSDNKLPFSYSELSVTLTHQISKNDKKDGGIYFTPPKTIDYNLKLLDEFIPTIRNVLEPSCGSCEFIVALNNKYQNLNITGIELNETIYESIKPLENEHITLYNQSYLEWNDTTKYDLIIGNPPYFVMSKTDVNSTYYNYFDGRPNIFILFLIKSLKLLNPDGILSFILPKNFLNCLYYNKTRRYILKKFKIINIIICDDNYLETKQDTIMLIIQNKVDLNQNYKFTLMENVEEDFPEDDVIFGSPENIIQLKLLYENSTTLSKLNFTVNVGNIVWNQVKDQLTDDTTKTLLIYSSDIRNNELCLQNYSNEDKKNYINRQGFNTSVLVINRGYGVGKYKFEYCLIEGNVEYLIENHLICVKYNLPINPDELISLYERIINSFENEKTKQFIQLYFGNNAINTTELQNILPIYF
jgi:type I restriction-modification system DNA methylase subunit